MKLTRRQWLLAGIGALGFGSWTLTRDAASNREEVSAMKLFTQQMKTYCVGRYLMDVPALVHDASGTYEMQVASVEVIDRTARERKLMIKALDDRLRQREAALREQSAPSGAGTRFLDSIRPTPSSWLLYFIAAGYSDGDRKVEGYIARDHGNFLFKANAFNAAHVKQFADFLAAIEPALSIRDNDEVPALPGFCIDNGLIALDPKLGENVNGWAWTLPGHPDVTFGLSTRTNHDKVRPGKLDREGSILREAGMLMQHVKTLRKRRFDLNGMAAQEWLVETTDSAPEYLFDIEIPGKVNDNANPFVSLHLNVGGSGPNGYVKPSLTVGESIALWDALIATFRLRPGAV